MSGFILEAVDASIDASRLTRCRRHGVLAFLFFSGGVLLYYPDNTVAFGKRGGAECGTMDKGGSPNNPQELFGFTDAVLFGSLNDAVDKE